MTLKIFCMSQIHLTILVFGFELYLLRMKETSEEWESRLVMHIIRLSAAFLLDSGKEICAKSSWKPHICINIIHEYTSVVFTFLCKLITCPSSIQPAFVSEHTQSVNCDIMAPKWTANYSIFNRLSHFIPYFLSIATISFFILAY